MVPAWRSQTRTHTMLRFLLPWLTFSTRRSAKLKISNLEPEAILHYANLFWIDALNRPVEGENPDWVWNWEEFFQRFKLANYKRRAKRAACLALLDALTQKSERNGLSGA